MTQLTVDQVLELAVQHQQAGQLAEAENLFRQILAAYPDQADAHHLLAALYLQANRPDLAEINVRHALLVRPDPAFHLTLGLILQNAKRTDEALLTYASLLKDHPDFAEAYVHQGVLLSALGRFDQAALAFQVAVSKNPDHPLAQGNLGIVLCHLKRWDEALWLLRAATARHPNNPDFHAALGAALYFSHQPDAALAACNKAVELNPTHGQAQHVIANILRDLGRPQESARFAEKAAELLPEYADVQVNQGETLRSSDQLDAAITHYRLALDRIPTSADLHNNLANCYKDTGLLDDAIAEYRTALTCPHANAVHFSNLIYTLHYHPAYTPELIADELKKFDAFVSTPAVKKQAALPHTIDKSPNRRLRVGYLSTEFRQHALGLNILPLLANHDKSQFELFCYADVSHSDFYTFRFRQTADHWHDVRGKSDDDLAALIRSHNIDILIDLHQHISGNRLPLYARKPAPVQIAFAGYPGSSGLAAMDYRLTDPYLEPLGQPQQPSTETALHLPATWWCYHPAVEVPINDLPALTTGTITFGNLNNFCKLNDYTYTLWAKILNAVPNSSLLLLAPAGSARDRTRAAFDALGIAPTRIRFTHRQSAGDYYKLYHQIDLSLDSFPCNGHTTSMDSFFMGVPVTTLIGDRLFGRATWSQLNNLGLPDLAAPTPEAFVERTIALAHDLPRLAELRKTLRATMKASPLMNEKFFAKAIESTFKQAWDRHRKQ